MQHGGLDFEPYANDPERWGASMVHHAEVLIPCLDAVGAHRVIEVGAYAGDLTRVLIHWAKPAGAQIVAVDPSPQDELEELAAENEQLELVRRTSLEALRELPVPDALIIDGDHNYYTVSEELRVIAGRVSEDELPLLLFHDVCWPHGRRDDYFDLEQIPPHYRHPVAGEDRGIYPGEPGVRPDGLPFPRSAEREGGARNGVLTAVEDFVDPRPDLQLAVVPAFFGFGAVWRKDAGYAEQLARVLEPWIGHTLLARLEENRTRHLAEAHSLRVQLWHSQELQRRQEEALRRLLRSSAFRLAERLSKLRVRLGIAPGDTGVSREDIRRALEET